MKKPMQDHSITTIGHLVMLTSTDGGTTYVGKIRKPNGRDVRIEVGWELMEEGVHYHWRTVEVEGRWEWRDVAGPVGKTYRRRTVVATRITVVDPVKRPPER